MCYDLSQSQRQCTPQRLCWRALTLTAYAHLQGVVGGMPWNAIGYATMWAQALGFSDMAGRHAHGALLGRHRPGEPHRRPGGGTCWSSRCRTPGVSSPVRWDAHERYALLGATCMLPHYPGEESMHCPAESKQGLLQWPCKQPLPLR